MISVPTQRGSVWLPEAKWCVVSCLLAATVLTMSSPAQAQLQQPKAGQTPKAKPAQAPVALPPVGTDNTTLPPNYIPPREPIPAAKNDNEDTFNPFQTKQARDRATSEYKQLLRDGTIKTPAQKKLITDMVHLSLAEMTLKANQARVSEIRKKITDELRTVIKGGKKGELPREVRIAVLDEIRAQAPIIMEKFHLSAGINAAILLAELNDYEEAQNQKAIPYVPAHKEMIELIGNANHPEAYRIWGAIGLGRILTLTAEEGLPTPTRHTIVAAIIAALEKSTPEFWSLQARQVEALGLCQVVSNAANKPVVFDALSAVLTDTKRPWLVRAEAAQAIGRLKMDARAPVNIGQAAVEIARLGQQIGAAYEKQPQKPEWGQCCFKIYLAFKPANADEKAKGYGLLNKGSLGTHQKSVQEAYDQLIPLVRQIVDGAINNKRADVANTLKSLNTWLTDKPTLTNQNGSGSTKANNVAG